jgi:hypothetical protein
MKHRILSVPLLLVASTGCITRAGGNLPPIAPAPPVEKPTLEQTVGDFEFTLEGGKMVTSTKMGRTLNDEILKRWKKKGYIADHSYVKAAEFTGSADYNLTLSGSQYGDSSIAGQILSGLTLLIIPYTVDTKYDVQYVLENVKTGAKFSASVEDSYHTIVELFLFLALPISARGQSETMDNMADHLYEQLRAQGAFGETTAPTALPRRVPVAVNASERQREPCVAEAPRASPARIRACRPG